MKVDVENISNEKTYGDQYMKFFIFLFFEETNIFPPEFLDQCENNPNEPQFLPSEVKVVLKTKWLWNKGYIHKW